MKYDFMDWFGQFCPGRVATKAMFAVLIPCLVLGTAGAVFVFVNIVKWLGGLWIVFGWAFIPVFCGLAKLVLLVVDGLIDKIK